jgi:DnaK suppressor protein
MGTDSNEKKGPASAEEAELTEEELTAFEARLREEHKQVQLRLNRHTHDLLDEEDGLVEEVDLANRQTDRAYQMRLVDKERKLLGQIARAINKFAEGDYGCCEGTGEVISRKRLELRPWTRYSVEYKEELERKKRQMARMTGE